MANERPSAVRLFAPDHPALAVTVRARLEKQRENQIEQMATGYAQEWGDYKQRVGIVKGLDEAIQICLNVEQELKSER